ncbi:zinc ABC transporter substrate-binding protein [bacterium]|nr:zinc ABC transporter substrate-binding protein [Akkermansiaceae bacterium]MDB4277299.1 zinc ABC transporter substrate-binding protein [bacterium]MDA7519437.1 zinc ABC transporter substrate-binding protein [Akkermansiaceae bacterium]MDA7675023.1 zinc ABC transporter substrate-binding protein [Akkermansiaceae bacterium]MDA7684265.1 zinc ABC transporter substrate-binding protein [Akkermansiaceae bacterium]
MKRRLLLCLAPIALLSTSCVKKKVTTDDPKNYPFEITTTVGMIADVTHEIAGEHAEVTNIIGEGIDPHAYMATKGDIDRLDQSDLVFYNGLHLEGKMGQVLESQRKKGKPVHAVSEALLGNDYKIIGGATESDPHVWMDVVAWALVAREITDRLAEFDPDHANDYETNLASYTTKLADLDAQARRCFASIPEKNRALVTAHDAFSYLGRAYGIDVRGIQGISTESEAGVKGIEDLVDFLVKNELPAVFVESSVSDKSVKAIIEGAAAQGKTVIIGGELFSDAMGQVGSYEGTYIGMIDHNITTITRALGGEIPAQGIYGKLTPTQH